MFSEENSSTLRMEDMQETRLLEANLQKNETSKLKGNKV